LFLKVLLAKILLGLVQSLLQQVQPSLLLLEMQFCLKQMTLYLFLTEQIGLMAVQFKDLKAFKEFKGLRVLKV